MHLHDPEFHDFDEMTAPGGAVDALLQAKERGEVGHIGLAGGDVQEMRRYLDLGVFEVLLVHNRWTLVDRSAGPLLDRAAELGVGVVNAAVLGGGILADESGRKTDYGYRPASPETLGRSPGCADVCRRWDTDLAAAAHPLLDSRRTVRDHDRRHQQAGAHPADPGRRDRRPAATISGTNSRRCCPHPTNWLDADAALTTDDEILKAEAPMPLVRIDMHRRSPTCARRSAAPSTTRSSDGWGMPADDLFHIFQLHDHGDLLFSRTFPDADRTDIVFVGSSRSPGTLPRSSRKVPT